MASDPPGDGGGGGESTDVSSATTPAALGKPRWSTESKVYTRKYHSKNPKPPPNSNPNPNNPTLVPTPTPPPPPPPPPPAEVVTPAEAAAPPPASSAPATASPPPSAPATAPAPDAAAAAAASDDASSSLNRDGGTDGSVVPNGHNKVAAGACDAARKRKGRREIRREVRRRLASELDKLRVLSKRLEVTAEAMTVDASAPPPQPLLLPPPVQVDTGYAHSQFSATDPGTPIPTPVATVMPVRTLLQRRLLTVSVIHTDPFEKEKRTPKANQYYHNSEFLLAKDKFPPADSHGQKKSKHRKKHSSFAADATEFATERRLYSHAFKKCSSLLSRLMKHKFGWVFNRPVDPVALGLHDYFAIIQHPMDLGTIKGRLNRGQYRNPRDFAVDVRLTFTNAMTYNPKGQDVHFMAEQLSGIFEAQWPEIEAEVEYLASCPPLPKKFPPPPIDLRFLERSDSTIHHVALDSKSRLISHTPPYNARTPALKKPKAKDPNKRDMTLEEKRKLSNNLQNLPPEKLDIVVQIIKNKNLSVRQHDDEIEVDIDSMDAETLWELDRFVTNYRKNLSKHKRKAERAMLARKDAEMHAQHAAQQRSQEPNVGGEPTKQNVMTEEQLATSLPAQDDNNGGNISRSSSSSSSSSDSGSSSSDSDSDSSSTDGSDATRSS